jgi:caa(3)-type oxidase subunit IV
MDAESSHKHDARLYVGAWISLLILTVLSFTAHLLPLGSFATFVSLLIAAIKASIVFAIFMHLTRETSSVRMVATLNVAFVVLLSVGIALDVASH